MRHRGFQRVYGSAYRQIMVEKGLMVRRKRKRPAAKGRAFRQSDEA